MPLYQKPKLEFDSVEQVLRNHLGEGVAEIEPMDGGNLSAVYSCSCGSKGYVIKFSDLPDDFTIEPFLSGILSGRQIPYPSCIGTGTFDEHQYIIQERMEGKLFIYCDPDEKERQLPELLQLLSRMNSSDISGTQGFGWITPSGNGAFPTWEDYATALFREEQDKGNFWENWHELFSTTILEKDVFNECYSRLLAYMPYNAPHRHLLHGDYHPWNILSDGRRITGIIDGNFSYGDFLVDLVTLDRNMYQMDIIEAFLSNREQLNENIPHFRERLKGAYYFKGVDALRFYAKMGYHDAYYDTREFLLKLD